MKRALAVAGLGLLLAGSAAGQLGRVDTIGGTTHDWLTGGPAKRYIVNSPGQGIHVAWIRSQTASPFYDRNMAHNFYDYAARRWLADDTADFMNSGQEVFLERAGFGTLDVDPRDGRVVISAHAGTPVRVELAREVSHGSFLYEYASGSPVAEGYAWPVLAVDTAGWAHVSAKGGPSNEDLFHGRMRTWGQWDSFDLIAPEAAACCQNIAASRVSHRVVLAWVGWSWPPPDSGYYRESTDGGTTWLDIEPLPFPPAYGGDTLPSFHISGLFPYYDRRDRLHVVAGVMPYIGGQGYILPAEIWHWCRDNSPQWTRIHRASADSLAAGVGYNALFAGRPSIGEDRVGGLHVAWEQFDPLNVEPLTDLLRADIWWARDNSDNGASWRVPDRLTDPDSSSKRFPAVMDYLSEDTLRVFYLIDSVAGFHVQGQGPATRNPVVVQHVPIACGAVSGPEPLRPMPVPGPTVVRGVLNLAGLGHDPGSENRSGSCPALLLDISGRKVMELVPGENDVRHLSPGVYFVRTALWERSPDRDFVRKVVIQR